MWFVVIYVYSVYHMMFDRSKYHFILLLYNVLIVLFARPVDRVVFTGFNAEGYDLSVSITV
jgi:hypothetical protein